MHTHAISYWGCCRYRPDVDVITANPKTAGVARWNFFALWGHRLDKGEAAAQDFTTKVLENGCYL